MILKVTHHTDYKYPSPVLFAPHTLRFHPRIDDHQSLKSFSILIDPTPESLFSESQSDSVIYIALFHERTNQLTISTELIIETSNRTPSISNWELNSSYPNAFEQSLRPALEVIYISNEVHEFAMTIAAEADHNALMFSKLLTTKIYNGFNKFSRLTGSPYQPSQTFSQKEGSCRDLTVLQMAISRAYGLASRFVSGYHYDEVLGEFHELHAWLEVYIPELGWIGFDSSYGVEVGSKHIAVCASPFPELTSPVTGSYWGVAEHTLETKIHVTDVSSLYQSQAQVQSHR